MFYGGDPKKLKSRIVIFGCLNDLDTWATSREEPLPDKFAKHAMEIRDYLSLFERGRVIWLGPGSERIWNYDGRNKIWDPWANAFMDIIAESGILIFKGRQALSARTLRKDGQNEHLEGTLSNKNMLIHFIHSSLKIASFIQMLKLTPAEAAATMGCKFEMLDTEQSDVASALEKEEVPSDEDPLGLAKLSLNPKPNRDPAPQMAKPVQPTPAAKSARAPGDWSKAKEKPGKKLLRLAIEAKQQNRLHLQ